MAISRATFDPFGDRIRQNQKYIEVLDEELQKKKQKQEQERDIVDNDGSNFGDFRTQERKQEKNSKLAAVQAALSQDKTQSNRHWYDDWQDALQQGIGNILVSNAQTSQYTQANYEASRPESLDPALQARLGTEGPTLISSLSSLLAPKEKELGQKLVQNNQPHDVMSLKEMQSQSLGQNLKDPRFYTNYLIPQGPLSLADLPKSYLAGAAVSALLSETGPGAAVGGTLTAAGISADSEARRDAASVYDELLSQGVKSEDALRKANDVYKAEVGALAAMSVPEMAAMLTPAGKVTRGLGKAVSKLGKVADATAKVGTVAGKAAATAASEGSTELYQQVVQNRAADNKDILSMDTLSEFGSKLMHPEERTPDEELSLRLGAIMGGAAGGAVGLGGVARGAVKTKDVNVSGYEADDIADSSPAPQIDPALNSSYHHKIVMALPDEELTGFKENIRQALDNGATDDQAIQGAVEGLMNKASTKTIVEKAYADTMAEYAAMAQTKEQTEQLAFEQPEAFSEKAEATVPSPAPMGSTLTSAGQARQAAGLLGGATQSAPASRLKVAQTSQPATENAGIIPEEATSDVSAENTSGESNIENKNSGALSAPTEPPIIASNDGAGLSQQDNVNSGTSYNLTTQKVDGSPVYSVVDQDGQTVFQAAGVQGHRDATSALKALRRQGQYVVTGTGEKYITNVNFDQDGAARYNVIDVATGKEDSVALTDADLKKHAVGAVPVTKEGRAYVRRAEGVGQRTEGTQGVAGQILGGPEESGSTGGRDSGVYNVERDGTQAYRRQEIGLKKSERLDVESVDNEGSLYISAAARVTKKEMSYIPIKRHTPNEKALVNLGQALGIEIRFFSAKDNDISEFVVKSNRKVVYVRHGGGSEGRTELWSLGHGFIHTLKESQPDLYKDLDVFLSKILKLGQLKEYRKLIPEGEYRDILKNSKDKTREEILADAFGNYVASEKFFRLMQEQDKPLYHRVVSFIRDTFSHLRSMITGKRVDDILARKQIDALEDQFEAMVNKLAQRLDGLEVTQNADGISVKPSEGKTVFDDVTKFSLRVQGYDFDFPPLRSFILTNKKIPDSVMNSWSREAKRAGVAADAIVVGRKQLGTYNKILDAGQPIWIPERSESNVVVLREGVLNTAPVSGIRRERMEAVEKAITSGQPKITIPDLQTGEPQEVKIPKTIRGLQAAPFVNIPVTGKELSSPRPENFDLPVVVTGNPHLVDFARPHPSWDENVKVVRVKPVFNGSDAVARAVVDAINYARGIGARILVTTFRAKQPWILAKFLDRDIVTVNPKGEDFDKFWKPNPQPRPADILKAPDWVPYVPTEQTREAFRANGWDTYKNIYGEGGAWWWPTSKAFDEEILQQIEPQTEIEYCDLLNKGCTSCRNCQKLTYPAAVGAPIFGITDEPFCDHRCPQCFVRMGQSGVSGRKLISIGVNAKQEGYGEADLGEKFRNSVSVIQKAVRPKNRSGDVDYIRNFLMTDDAGKLDIATSMYLNNQITLGDFRVIQGEVAGQVDQAVLEEQAALTESPGFRFSARKEAPPEKTLTGYKLVRFKNDKIYPLFVKHNQEIPIGVWLDADEGQESSPTKTGSRRVQAKGGSLSYRPGWHLGDIPNATHIGQKDADGKIKWMHDDTVWAECEYAADINYQDKIGRNGLQEIPVNGYYRYKTNESMTGDWAISGAIKVNRILSDDEARAITEEAGYVFLPRKAGTLDIRYSARKETDINTPEFKRWFGNSKVVDEKGNPKAVYHGTAFGGFTEFDPEKISMSPTSSQQGTGFYFTDKLKWAEEYLLKNNGKGKFVKSKNAEMFKVYLSIQSPLDISDHKRTLADEQILNIIRHGAEWNKGWWKWYYTRQKNISDEDVFQLFLNDVKDRDDNYILQQLPQWFGYQGAEKLLKTFENVTGYDGIAENFRKQGYIYVVFSPTQIKSVYNQGAWDDKNPDIRYSARKEKSEPLPWPKDFPEVLGQMDINKLRSYEGYRAAKDGDLEAALKVIDAAVADGGVNLEAVEKLFSLYPNAKILPVHAEESAGKNELPLAYALTIHLATGNPVAADIIQNNRAGHTGANALTRFLNRATFEGQVESGQEYVIVDDMILQGGTVSDLRKYVELNDGKVVAVTTLATGRDSTLLPITDDMKAKLERKFGNDEIEQFLRDFNISGGVEGLTQSEARFLYRWDSVDALRERIAAGGFEGRFERGELGEIPEDAAEERLRTESVTPKEGDAGDVYQNEIRGEGGVLTGENEGIDRRGFTEAERRRYLGALTSFHGYGYRSRSFRLHPELLSTAEYEVPVRICAELGLDLVPFSYANPDKVGVDGLITPAGEMFVNTEGQASPEAIAWHERGHWYNSDAARFEKLRSLVVRRLEDTQSDGVQKLIEYYQEKYPGSYTEDEILEEFTCDMFAQALSQEGAFFTEQELRKILNGFIEEVLNRIRESNDEGLRGEIRFSKRKNRDLGDGTRSEAFPTTAGEGGQLDPWAAAAVGAETQPGGRGTYTPIKLSDLDQEALKKYTQDPLEAERFLRSDFDISQAPLAVAVSRHLVLDQQERAQRLEYEGDYEAAQVLRNAMVDTVMRTAEQLRTYGQAVSAARLYQTIDPASALIRAERVARRAYNNYPRRLRDDIEDIARKGAEEMNRINGETSDAVAGHEDVRQDLEEALERAGQRRQQGAAETRKQEVAERRARRKEPAELLAGRVRAYLSASRPEDDPVKEMVSTLFKVAQERLPVKEAPAPKSPLDAAVAALVNREQYREVWKEAQTIFEAKYGDQFDGIEDYLNHYLSQPYSQSLVERAVNGYIKESKINVSDLIAAGRTGELRGRVVRALSREPELHRALGREFNTAIGGAVDKIVAEHDLRLQRRLAKRVIDAVEGKGKDPGASADMMKTLMQVAKVRTPVRERLPRNEMELVAQAIRNRKLYRHIWDGAKRQIIAKYGADHEAVKALTAFFETPFGGASLEPAINQGLKESEIKLSELVRKHYTEVDAAGRSLGEKLTEGLDLSEADSIALANKIQRKMQEISHARKEKILDNIIKGKAAANTRRKRDLISRICEYSNLGAFNADRCRQAICEELGLPAMTDDVAKLVVELTDRIQTTTGDVRDEACMMLDALLANMRRPSLLRKVSTLQTISMLLNPKTILRNILGNTMFYVAERFSHIVATPIDWTRSKWTGSERTVTFRTGGQHGFWDGFMKGARAGWNGWAIRGLETQYDIGRGLTFDSKGNYGEKLASLLERSLKVVLQGFDYATYNLVYKQTLGEMAVLQLMNSGQEITQEKVDEIIGQLDLRLLEMADQAGKYATFQDNNALSSSLVKIKNALNFGKDWGLGDAVLKFPKTPGALMMRGIEYSPAGFVRSAMIAAQPYVKGRNDTESKEADPRELTLSIARACIGTTGLTGLAFILAALGILTPPDSDDADVRELKTAQGIGEDRINVSAFGRWFFSGFDDGQAAMRVGDILVSYDWAQPLALSVSFGVGLSEALDSENTAGERAMSIPSAVATGLASGVSTLAEQPLLQGIQKLFQPSYGDSGADHVVKVLGTIAGDIPATFVPTSIYQLRQLLDENKRDIKEADMLAYAWNKVVNKVPGASEQLPVKYDTLGQPATSYWQGTNNLFNVLLNPAYVSRYKPTPEATLVLDLYQRSGDTGQFPHSLQRYIKYDGKRYDLNPAEYQQLQKATGQAVSARFRSISPILSDERKIEKMAKILEEEGSRARKRFLREKNLK